MILLYIYIEKKVFYNIEGQLRGLQWSGQPKTCAPEKSVQKGGIPFFLCVLKPRLLRRCTKGVTKSLSVTAINYLNFSTDRVRLNAALPANLSIFVKNRCAVTLAHHCCQKCGVNVVWNAVRGLVLREFAVFLTRRVVSCLCSSHSEALAPFVSCEEF